jgi:hypothetical protein
MLERSKIKVGLFLLIIIFALFSPFVHKNILAGFGENYTDIGEKGFIIRAVGIVIAYLLIDYSVDKDLI